MYSVLIKHSKAFKILVMLTKKIELKYKRKWKKKKQSKTKQNKKNNEINNIKKCSTENKRVLRSFI